MMPVDVEGHGLLHGAEGVEHLGVGRRGEHRLAPVRRRRGAERLRRGSPASRRARVCDGWSKLAGTWKASWPPGATAAELGQQGRVVVHPVQRGVGEHEVDRGPVPGREVAQREGEPGPPEAPGLEHGRRGVDPDGPGRPRRPGGDRPSARRYRTRGRPRTAGDRRAERHQVVERLAPLGLEPV